MSENLLNVRNTLATGAAVAALALLPGCTPRTKPNSPESAATASCAPVDEGLIRDRDELFRAVTDTNTGLYEAELHATMMAEAERIGLHYPETTELRSALENGNMTPEAAVSLVNEHTLATYGFETTAVIDPSNLDQTVYDLKLLLDGLSEEFVEIVRLEGVSQYIIGSPEPAAKEEPAAAFIRYEDSGWKIFFGPGNTQWARTHEGSHALHQRYVEKFCAGSTHYQVDPVFGSKNPEGFVYGSPFDEDITVAPHDKILYHEDVTETLRILRTPGVACTTLRQRHDVIIAKMAVASVWLDKLYPGYGDFVAKSLGWRCGSFA